ncbi:Ribokinase, putative [Pediculus humanus corporis]|uniref:Ribokinase n=1 Tax=Pediculus humanus subsp. corporis TaxID=121224 RepID=E0VX59_PEDHC|nr:Ribokinase, putative [Pediculus humanus corporis]EEB17965.1 Ribokinase, putative [Pediculus humanus corporis]
MDAYDVVVVGSCMIDLICYAPRLPRNGETLYGTNFVMGFGGKGCNQCVSAKKLGANATIIARLGNDSFGQNYFNKLKEYEISTKYISITDGTPSGMAQITVSESGENHIIIVPGANKQLNESDVLKATEVIETCKVLMCQLEVSENATLKALQVKSNSKKGISILNASPANIKMNPLLFTLPDIFCVNETEAEIYTNVKINEQQHAVDAIKILLLKGCKKVIITLGEKGSVYGEKGNSNFICVPVLKVNAIDTTGAGDAFLGALSYFLSKHSKLDMEEMIKRANNIAALSVQKLGTQESFPIYYEVPKHLLT